MYLSRQLYVQLTVKKWVAKISLNYPFIVIGAWDLRGVPNIYMLYLDNIIIQII